MAANSRLRRWVKRVLFRFFPEGWYRLAQGSAMAWDIRTRAWFEPEIELLPAAVDPGDCVVDVGANFGMYSYHLSCAVGRHGVVYAFEPVAWTRSVFKLVSLLLGMRNIRLVPLACGDRKSAALIRIPLQAAGSVSAGLAHVVNGPMGSPNSPSAREIQVEMTALDDFFDDHAGRKGEVSFIKCDVEGSEFLVMLGARRLIERCNPTVVCEIVASRLAALGGSVLQLALFFEERGYQLYVFQPRQNNPRLLPIGAGAVTPGTDNYIFIHPSRLNRFSAFLQPQE